MPEETLLGFDYGERRIGVAIGNTITRTARPLTTIEHRSTDECFEKIAALLREWQPARLVVGVPYHLSGDAHAMTVSCTRFANRLHGRFGLPIHTVDERLSSAEASAQHRGLANKIRIDAEAATIILQQYFEEHLQ